MQPVGMAVGHRALLDLHARAFNARDPETFAANLGAGAVVYQDGAVAGQGPEAARRLVRQEFARAAAATVWELDTGERVMLEWSDAERGGEAVGVLRVAVDGERVQSVRFDHDRALVERLVSLGRRPA